MENNNKNNNNAVIIDNKDDVVVVIYPIKAGDDIIYIGDSGKPETIKALDDIALFHKVAIKDISKGSNIIKYGEYIGVATQEIKVGQHVHTHNCSSSDSQKQAAFACYDSHVDTSSIAENNGSYKNSKAENALNNEGQNDIAKNSKSEKYKCSRTFMGYKRPDGKVGVRNHVFVLPTSVCASDVTERITKNVKGCVTFHNQNGCSQVTVDRELTIRTFAGLAANPNVHSILAVSLGCEDCQNDIVVDAIKKVTNKPVETLIIQKVGGSVKAIEKGSKIASKMVKQAGECKREEFGVDKLILGTNCGGSDPSSGLGANPLIGMVSDWFVAQGATSILSETPEIFGGEHILARRSCDKQIGQKVLDIVKDYENYVHSFGAEMREGNPSPGNKAGGLTTLEEKALGCIHKSGHSKVNNVYDYASQLKMGEGLVVMDTPGNDASSVGGMIAGGSQVVLFSTGLGTPTGNAIAPVFRITANPNTAKSMQEDTDMDVSETIFGPRTMIELRDALIDQIIEVCNGKKTRTEFHGYMETCLPHLCNYM